MADASVRLHSQASISKFLFMKLQTTDDEELACGDEAFIKGLGSISLRVCRISAMGKSVPVPASGSKLGVATKLIDEKSKKGKISHQTGYALFTLRERVTFIGHL